MSATAEPSDVAHVHARVLPDGAERDLWIVEGRITLEPQDGAETIADGGWVMPALIDAHVHLGMPELGGPLDLEVLDDELGRPAAAGVSAARVMGSPSPLPDAVLDRGDGPLLQSAGVALAAPGRFFPGWGEIVGPDDLVQACARAGMHTWIKIILDWFDEDGGYAPAFPAESLAAAVAAAHRGGRRVAVHAQSAEGGRIAVAAGVDSIEHGMHLPFDVLEPLAQRGGILVPTGHVFEQLAPGMTGDEVPRGVRQWFAEGHARHAELARRAWQAGVVVLAGTDQPVGALLDEIA